MLLKIKNSKDFRYILDNGEKFIAKGFLLFVLKSNEVSYLNYGIIASSKVGKAVVRNKIKRQLKHIILKNLNNIVGYDLCIVATRNYNALTFAQVNYNLNKKLKEAKII